MACDPKLYVSTDVDIPIEIATGASFVTSDISDIEIILTKRDDATVSKSYKYSTGGIDITGGVITLLIDKLDITLSGSYGIKILMTDTASQVRGLTPCPATLQFFL
jgi:hypothetical protein